MYRTVIVDDDFLVRSYLRQLDAWQKSGYEIIADLRDGEEALDVVEKERPDLIVTDISMPLMDGIELIRRVRTVDSGVYIIVLSCHDDFEYVKEAMKLGANEYVLKNSLNEESLFEILEKTKVQLAGMKTRQKEVDETKKLVQMGRQSMKYHFFNGLLSGSFSMEERECKRKEAGIHGRFTNSAVVSLFMPGFGELKGRNSPLELEQYSQHLLRKLYESLTELLGEDKKYVEEVYLGEGVFCCFLDLSQIHRNSLMRQRLTTVATACYQCSKEEPYTFAVGVSGTCFGEDGIRQAYQQVREVTKLFFYEEGSILYYEGEPFIGHELPMEAESLLKAAVSYIERQQADELECAFGKAVDAFEKYHTESRIVLHWLKELEQLAGIERGTDAYANLIKISQIRELGGEYRIKMQSVGKKPIPSGAGPVTRTAVNFMHEHYREQIGLTDTAEAAKVNPAYLSYLFKQEMGIGFSSYLMELRMECAKSLLCNTNEKIKDVAALSGMNDYHYFSKAFKKQTGVSPADYRRAAGLSGNDRP